MKNRCAGRIAVLSMFAAMGSALTPSAFAGISTLAWQFDTTARERIFEDVVVDGTDTLPFDKSSTAVQGSSMSMSEYEVDGLGGAMDFKFAFDHMPSYYRGQAMSTGFIEFVVASPTEFSITGLYDLVGRGTGRLEVGLVALGEEESVLFYNLQTSQWNPSVTLVVGGMGGDKVNELVGAPEGTLSPGSYRFEYTYSRKHDLADYLPGTGEGQLHLVVAPEPASLALLLIGGVAVMRRKAAR